MYWSLISPITHYIGHITAGSVRERGNEYTLVGHDFALLTAGHQNVLTIFTTTIGR